jgi:hypothetical protein
MIMRPPQLRLRQRHRYSVQLVQVVIGTATNSTIKLFPNLVSVAVLKKVIVPFRSLTEEGDNLEK